MNNSPYIVKVLKSKIEDHLDSKKLEDLLLEGCFYDFEKQLFESLMELYDRVSSAFLEFISESAYFEQQQRRLAEIMNLKKLKKRLTKIQLRTGTKVKVNSFYAKKVPRCGRPATYFTGRSHATTTKKQPD